MLLRQVKKQNDYIISLAKFIKKDVEIEGICDLNNELNGWKEI